jgi:protein kinase-like protein
MDNLLPLGGTFAGLHVESLVGRGGMGVVYRARQASPARTVALKILAPELDGDAVARGRFLAEIELLAAVEHPHVVPIYDAGEFGGRLWLTMRLLGGPSLRALVERRGPLAPAPAVELLAPIASVLDAIHDAGLVHGDVGPANVLLDVHGEPYLTDFGIARRLGAPAERLGTLAYLAPERIVDAPAGDGGGAIPEAGGAAADRYAFAGLVLYALTGRPPFEGPTPDDVLRAHLDAPPPSASSRRPSLPAAIDAVVARGLAKEPGARYPSAGAMLEAVRAALSLRPAGSADPSAATIPVSRPTTAALVAAAASPAWDRFGRDERPVARHGRRSGARRPTLAGLAATGLGLVAVLLATGLAFGIGLVPVAGSFGPGLPAAARSEDPAAGSATATPTPKPTPTPTPTPRPTPKPTAAPRLGTSADVARLRALLPPAVRNDCRSSALEGGALVAAGDTGYADGLAAVTCRPSSGAADGAIRYVLFADEAAVGTAWQSTLQGSSIGNGSCEAGSTFSGQWRQPGGLFGLEPARTGRVACWFGRDGNARIDWTVDGLPVLVTLRRQDEDLAAAYERWSANDLTPRDPNR